MTLFPTDEYRVEIDEQGRQSGGIPAHGNEGDAQANDEDCFPNTFPTCGGCL